MFVFCEVIVCRMGGYCVLLSMVLSFCYNCVEVLVFMFFLYIDQGYYILKFVSMFLNKEGYVLGFEKFKIFV